MKPTPGNIIASIMATLVSGSALAQQKSPETVTLKSIYFCDTKDDTKRFLSYKAAGENSIMAADRANKDAGRQTCAVRMSSTVVPGKETTEFDQGLAFNMQSFTFPEEGGIERFHGSVLGSMQVAREADI